MKAEDAKKRKAKRLVSKTQQKIPPDKLRRIRDLAGV